MVNHPKAVGLSAQQEKSYDRASPLEREILHEEEVMATLRDRAYNYLKRRKDWHTIATIAIDTEMTRQSVTIALRSFVEADQVQKSVVYIAGEEKPQTMYKWRA